MQAYIQKANKLRTENVTGVVLTFKFIKRRHKNGCRYNTDVQSWKFANCKLENLQIAN